MGHYPNWLKVVNVLSVLILILIILLGIDGWLLRRKAAFEWQFIRVWPLFGF